jgi:hypothetical protein
MESDTRVLTLLSLAVLASGCIHSGGGTVTEGPESVVIEEMNVQPAEIYSGQPVRASLTAANAGSVEAEVLVGEDGGKILGDYCVDLFELDSFSASSSRSAGTQSSYRLESGERVNARWTLQQQGNVPIYGKRCNLEFSVPFNYSVESYRQVQVKQDRNVEGSESLASESTSGPLVLAIDTLPGSTGQSGTYVLSEDGDDTINVLIELINSEPEQEFNKGLVNVDKSSLEIEASEPLQLDEEFQNGEWVANGYSETRCEVPESEIRMVQGRSVTISCEIPIEQDIDAPSVLSEISAAVDYTYVKSAGQVEVSVNARE